MIRRLVLCVLVMGLSCGLFGQENEDKKTNEKNNTDKKIEALEQKVNELTEKLEKVEKQNELNQLKERAENLSRQKKKKVADTGRKFHSGLRQQSALNPNISMGGDFYAAFGTSKSDYNRIRSDNSCGTGRMFLREIELGVESALDPFTRGKVFMGIGEEGIEVEEAYLQWLNFPLNMNLKMGQFKNQFGKLNRYHNHALPQFDRASVLVRFFGMECLNGFGLAGNFLLPSFLAHVNELDIEFVSGGDDHSFTSQGKQNFITVFHLKNYYDINRSTYVEIGLSGAFGHHNARETDQTRIGGADITLKWAPPDKAKYRGIEWITELLYSSRETSAENINAFGFYSSVQCRLGAWWLISTRVDYTELPHYPSLKEKGISFACDFWQSEFVFLRLQYSYLDRNFEDNDHRLIFQTCWAMGPHKHEAY